MTRIKICGMTRPQDALAAAEAGADAIGLVFAKSPRQVTPRMAGGIVSVLPPFVSIVGVFVNARPSSILRLRDTLGLTEIQLHGDESPDYVAKLPGCRVIKALRVRDRSFIDLLPAYAEAGVSGLLLDAFSPQARGGSGRRFDWDLVIGLRDSGHLTQTRPLILAGGLTPDNVAAGVRRIRPWGVDVSSGVEEELGVKSVEKMTRFVAAVRGV